MKPGEEAFQIQGEQVHEEEKACAYQKLNIVQKSGQTNMPQGWVIDESRS